MWIHLYADDIILVSNNTDKFHSVLIVLHVAFQQVGFAMQQSKDKDNDTKLQVAGADFIFVPGL